MTSIANSPGIPHDPAKNPEKSLLKKSQEVLDRSAELHPIQLNTQLNSVSPRGTKLIGKQKMMAKEFFWDCEKTNLFLFTIHVELFLMKDYIVFFFFLYKDLFFFSDT